MVFENITSSNTERTAFATQSSIFENSDSTTASMASKESESSNSNNTKSDDDLTIFEDFNSTTTSLASQDIKLSIFSKTECVIQNTTSENWNPTTHMASEDVRTSHSNNTESENQNISKNDNLGTLTMASEDIKPSTSNKTDSVTQMSIFEHITTASMTSEDVVSSSSNTEDSVTQMTISGSSDSATPSVASEDVKSSSCDNGDSVTQIIMSENSNSKTSTMTSEDVKSFSFNYTEYLAQKSISESSNPTSRTKDSNSPSLNPKMMENSRTAFETSVGSSKSTVSSQQLSHNNIIRSWMERMSSPEFHSVVANINSAITGFCPGKGNTVENFRKGGIKMYYQGQRQNAKSHVLKIEKMPQNVDYVENFKVGDGIKYEGGLADGLADGEGELTVDIPDVIPDLETGKLCGNWRQGILDGAAKIFDHSQARSTDLMFRSGLRHGFYRTFSSKGQLLSVGEFRNGEHFGKRFSVGSGHSSYFLGNVSQNGEYEGEVLYLYPNCVKAILGNYKNGKMKSGHWVSVLQVKPTPNVVFPLLELSNDRRGGLQFDPSTFMRISREPLMRDEYESETVYVKESTVPFAGEGLFAARNIEAGELVSLFNGNKVFKCSNKRCIGFGDTEWSDFRLTLDKTHDLDIPAEYQSTKEYVATLGHKACHHFQKKNSQFQEFEHPRFGRIMSIFAVKNIEKDEEIFVSYNYDVDFAPPWYREQWKEFQINK